MKAPAILPNQTKAIHAIRKRVRLDEGSYRAMLEGFGVGSSKHLTREDADRLLARMGLIPGAERPATERASAKGAYTASGRYAGKLRALWIAGWNLGLIADRSDRAMHLFVARQTGIPHSRFLVEAKAAQAAIEGLKGWIERGAGVDWPARTGDAGLDALADKKAVLKAQWRRLAALGAVRLGNPLDHEDGLAEYVAAKTRGGSRRLSSLDDATVTADELDAGSAALGRWLRVVLSTREGSR